MSYVAMGQDSHWCPPYMYYDEVQGGCEVARPADVNTYQQNQCSMSGGAWVRGACLYPGTPGYPAGGRDVYMGGTTVTPGGPAPSYAEPSDTSATSDTSDTSASDGSSSSGGGGGGSWWSPSDASVDSGGSGASTGALILFGVGAIALGWWWLKG